MLQDYVIMMLSYLQPDAPGPWHITHIVLTGYEPHDIHDSNPDAVLEITYQWFSARLF